MVHKILEEENFQIKERILKIALKLFMEIDFCEVSIRVDSKFIATHTLTLLQNAIVLWAMNQNIDMKMLFEINFKYLWNNIKVPESNLVILDNNIIDECIDNKCETNFYFM